MAESDRPFTRRDLLAGASLGTVAVLGAMSPAAAGALRTVRRTTTTAASSTLVVAADAVGGDYAPGHVFQGWGHETARIHIYDRLYDYPNGDATKRLVPSLALEFPERVKGKRQYDVKLRRGVRFHDGTPFNADSVVFNFMRYIDKAHPFYDAGAIYVGGFNLVGISKVEAINAHTVRFTLNRPLADFKAQLVAFAGIASPTAVRAAGVANFGQKPVGTGPYRFVEAVRGDHVTLERFDGYWGPKAKTPRLIIRAMPDPSAVTAALLSGVIQLTLFPSVDDVPMLMRNSKFRVGFKPSIITGYAEFNVSRGDFRDQRVRLAACRAINKRRLINVALNGFGNIGAGVNPLPSWGYQSTLKDHNSYNPSAARTLLQAAGGSQSVTLSVQSSGYWPRMAEAIQADWNAVGLRTTIRPIDSAAFYGTMTQGQHDVFIGDVTPLLFQPYVVYNVLFGCANPLNKRAGGFCDPAFDRTLLRLLGTSDRPKATAAVKALDLSLLDKGVFQPNYYPTLVSVRSANVQGFIPPSSRAVLLSNVRVA